MPIINLTPHTVAVHLADGETVALPQGGRPARVVCDRTPTAPLVHDGLELPTYSASYGVVQHLPAPSPGVFYVVSRTVAHALLGTRSDLLVVHDLVLDVNRRVVGCRALLLVG